MKPRHGLCLAGMLLVCGVLTELTEARVPYQVFFPSAALTATTNGVDLDLPDTIGATCWLDITAVSGTTPTLDVKFQRKDPLSGDYHDLPGAAFSQKTAVGQDDLTIYPGIGETANESVSDVFTGRLRAVATIGGTTPSFTFSLVCVPIR